MTNETVFLDVGDVKVTNARFVVRGKTYALGSITSFRKQSSEIKQASKEMWLVLGILATSVLILPSMAILIAGVFGLSAVQLFPGSLLAFLSYRKYKSHQL